jgi:hypothetical protein
MMTTILAKNLTKREVFAAMAMQGLIAGNCGEITPVNVGHDAVMYADELIAALARDVPQRRG